MFPGFLTLLLVRIGLGERLEKAKKEDYRSFLGFLFLLPYALALWLYLWHSFSPDTGGVATWATLVGVGLCFFFVQAAWALFVPTSVSLTLGVITWLVILWMAWHGKLWL